MTQQPMASRASRTAGIPPSYRLSALIAKICGGLFQKRRQLTETWEKFCAAPPLVSKIVPIRPAKIQRQASET
jgi:hypothetical protein